ncbi:hypothetical protein GUJ93_ZPchr0005g15014 [Zizania palustris]|uniref:Uncharacterized protein n=1 Tax=Zizania palustris TaxID=103762 RepID=A0A8J5VR86_ZIZPA|nr:hypothetical protein GUJ93_ZPchr0005g15014 [Zizania palustris]
MAIPAVAERAGGNRAAMRPTRRGQIKDKITRNAVAALVSIFAALLRALAQTTAAAAAFASLTTPTERQLKRTSVKERKKKPLVYLASIVSSSCSLLFC